jgi:membrane-associated phospholipid phosphatase
MTMLAFNKGEILSNIALWGYIAHIILNKHAIWYKIALFLVANDVLNRIFKSIVRDITHAARWSCRPDPKQSCSPTTAATDMGMPSGHSQAIGFLVGYTSNKINMIDIAAILAVTTGRVIGLRHTVPQVIIGVIIGYIFGQLAKNYKHTKK